ncbi:lipopolysaccharide biosynthesis protein [Erwinia sp. E_sp_B01_9]|uniref:lipopolysaccharide biosynthesis protein n=1 Tax=Erwinia sp. E_sp_B01_9 TaxID=3039403 RepID=UPI003D9BEAFD
MTSYVAKYIGPSLFGALSLAMAVFQIVQTVAQMGGENIIFKRVAKKVDSGVRLIRASFMLRLMLYTVLAIPVVLYFWFSADKTAFVFAISVALACLFSAIDVYTIYNNSTLSSKYNAVSNVIGLVIGLGVRYIIAQTAARPDAAWYPDCADHPDPVPDQKSQVQARCRSCQTYP